MAVIIFYISALLNITSGESIVIRGVMAIVAGNCTNSRKVIKAVLITQVIVFAITFILCGAGVIQDYIFDPGTRARHSLGFTWTTTPIIIFMFMIMEYCYLRGRDLTLFEICLLEFFMTILFVLTNTRMCYAVTTLMLIVIALNKYFKWRPAKRVKKNTGRGTALLISVTEPRLWNLTFSPLPSLLIDAVKDRNSFSTQEVVSNV